MNLIEVTTLNGYKKAIVVSQIESINELPYRDASKSSVAIVLKSGNEIYCTDSYRLLVQLLQGKGDIS